MAKTQEISTSVRGGRADVFQPKDLEQLQQVATVIAKSNCIPQRYVGKPGDIIVAGMTGRELGMGLMQSLQAIYVVHGTPGMFVEHMIGLVRASGKCEYMHTTVDRQKMVATCRTKRTDEVGEHVYTFSKADADQAGYTRKGGAWSERDHWMVQVRATGNAIKHVYPDVTKGMQVAEMVQEYAASHPPAPTEAELMPREIGATVVEPKAAGVPEERIDPPPADVFADPAAPSPEDVPDEPGSTEPDSPPEPGNGPPARSEARSQPPLPPTPPEALQPKVDRKTLPWPRVEGGITEGMHKRLWAIFYSAKKAGTQTEDSFRAELRRRGFEHADQVTKAAYDSLTDWLVPGSSKKKAAAE